MAAFVALIVAMAGESCAAGVGEPRSSDTISTSLLETVIAAVEANYDLITTADVHLECIAENQLISQATERESTLENGGRVKVRLSPLVRTNRHLLISGPDWQCIDEREETGLSGPRSVNHYLQVGDRFWHYSPRAKSAWIRMHSQVGQQPALDVRHASTLQACITLSDQLRRHSCSTTSDQQGDQVAVTCDMDAGNGYVWRYVFSSDVGLLPVELRIIRPDGSVGQYWTCEYREVLDGQAWFPGRIVRTAYAESARNGADRSWVYRETMTVTKLDVNLPLPELKLDLPDGVRLVDVAARQVRHVGGHPRSREHTPLDRIMPATWRWYLLLANVSVLLLVGAVYFHRRFRKKSNRDATVSL